MSRYDFDMIVIGLGPAGMAVSIMGSEMGLNVCAIERHKIGGECMNVGCIPSKALLRMAKTRHTTTKLSSMELAEGEEPAVKDPFTRIQQHIRYINEKKTMAMFKKVNLVLGEGEAEFINSHTVAVGEKRFSAKRIFICAGTKPSVPPIPGIEKIDILTNENIFSLPSMPKSMIVIGGGAIGCEMAQAFSRLGCKTSIVQMDPHLLPFGDEDSGLLLEKVFNEEGIDVFNSRKLTGVRQDGDEVVLSTDQGEELRGEKLLVAAGRKMDFTSLKLEAAGVKYGKKGIEVNNHLQTSQKHIFAPGDCNGHYLLSHAAMHQGMIALMNCMMPGPFKMNFKKFVVPWTVFTEPQVSHVGKRQKDLDAAKTPYEVIECKYEDYGAAIAECVDIGYVKALASKTGRIHGARIVGEGSGEMINEWGLAIQKKIRMHDIMFLQHSFPTMSFLTKRVSETWMMKRMESKFLKCMMKWMF